MAGARKAIEHLDLPKGYKLEGTGQHQRIVCDDGEILRLPSGMPVTISLSPGISKTKRVEKARVQKALRHKEGR